MYKRPIIAVDFDGTIVEHRYPEIGKENDGAFDCLEMLQDVYDAKLILYTMRSDEKLKEAVEYCLKRGIVFWGINKNPEQHLWTKSPKVYAQYYIDDASVLAPLMLDSEEKRFKIDWFKIQKYFMNTLKKPTI